jgi:translation initiation factor 1
MNKYMDLDSFDTPTFTQASKIHLRLTKLGSKCITIIEGLDEDLDLKRITRAMKKFFCCAVTVKKDDDVDIIQLQGDHRTDVISWLVANEVLTKAEADERIIVHGG